MKFTYRQAISRLRNNKYGITKDPYTMLQEIQFCEPVLWYNNFYKRWYVRIGTVEFSETTFKRTLIMVGYHLYRHHQVHIVNKKFIPA